MLKPDIQDRTYKFALRIVKLSAALPKAGALQVLARQILKLGTSVGANVREAQNAFTRKEFAYFMNVARREAGETHYWLSLLSDAGVVKSARLADILAESDEIARILGAIVKKASRSHKGPPKN